MFVSSIYAETYLSNMKQFIKGKKADSMGDKVECPNCKWNWEIESADDRPYLCHKGGYDSELGDFDEVALKQWKAENGVDEMQTNINNLKTENNMNEDMRGITPEMEEAVDLLIQMLTPTDTIESLLDNLTDNLSELPDEIDMDFFINNIDAIEKEMLRQTRNVGFVGKQMDANKYDKLSDDEKMEKLLSVFSDPDEAESHLYKKFMDLPPVAQSNISDKETANKKGKWPAEWNALVDRVNQDPNIEAFESTGPGGGALSRLRNLKTREEFTVVIPRDTMYRGRAYAMYTPDYTRRTGSKPPSGTTVSISQLIDLFNKSANDKMQENNMKLKNLLQENMRRFATKNIAEQNYKSNRSTYSRGEWYSRQERDDNKPDRSKIIVDKWDRIVDEYNNKDGYEVESGTDPGLYHSVIKNTTTGDYFEVIFKRQAWSYYANINGKGILFKDNPNDRALDQLIAKFHDVFESDKDSFKKQAQQNESIWITPRGEQQLREMSLADRIKKNLAGNK